MANNNTFRPGPPHLEPGLAPDGVVIHVYDLTGDLLLERPLRTVDEADLARQDARTTAEKSATPEIVIVIYDGDTGERWHPKNTAGAVRDGFVCPRCKAISYNPNDLAEGYCGRCHWWTGNPVLGQFEPPHLDDD